MLLDNVDDEIIELEWRLQTATADYLTGKEWRGNKVHARHTIPFRFLKYHHPALEYRGEGSGEAAKYKRRGSTPGIWDWLLWGPNRWHAQIELKVAGRGLNDNQKETDRWLTEYGFPHAIARSVTEFRDIIIEWGWECHNMACKEPIYHTKEQMRKLAINAFAPPKNT